MSEALPIFKYHFDPLATKAIVASSESCLCCGQNRGYIYVGPVYGTRDDLEDRICPWCIFDGQAAAAGISFTDEHRLIKAGLAAKVIEEVSLRTPGYVCWQAEDWLSHCGDACEFHGDATLQDIENASDTTKQDWMTDNGFDENHWQEITNGYQPGGDPAFYKFVCRHCGLVRLGWDCP